MCQYAAQLKHDEANVAPTLKIRTNLSKWLADSLLADVKKNKTNTTIPTEY